MHGPQTRTPRGSLALVLTSTVLLAGACAHTSRGAQGAPASTDANAETSTPAGSRGAGRVDLFKGIELSDAQRTQIDSIRAGYRTSIEALQPGPGMSQESRQRFRQLMQQQVSDIRAVLTPDQQQTFDQNVAQMRANRRGRGGRRGAGGSYSGPDR